MVLLAEWLLQPETVLYASTFHTVCQGAINLCRNLHVSYYCYRCAIVGRAVGDSQSNSSQYVQNYFLAKVKDDYGGMLYLLTYVC